MEKANILRIVVASPSDVQEERNLLAGVIEELNRQIATDHGLRLELYRWETDSHPGFHVEGPQGLIDAGLRISECDLLICIFWKRFGTPTQAFNSGTEHEFNIAYGAWRKNGRPQIMVYFSERPYTLKSKEEVEQVERIVRFRDDLPSESLWWTYNDSNDFAKITRNHLIQFTRRIAAIRRSDSPPEDSEAGRSLDDLINSYRVSLAEQISTIRLFDGADLQRLEKVFVELTITKEYERPFLHNAWLSLVDAEMRRRRDVLGDDEETPTEEKEKILKVKETIKPDALLRERTHTVITGAPGCGKTTLIKYLALKTLADNNRFPVLLELKSVTEQSFMDAREDLVDLVFEKALAAKLQFGERPERDRFRRFFIERLRRGEVAIFLDGLDEVRGEAFFPSLCRSVNEFIRSAYRSNDLIITTRPYALETRFEGLIEMEIAPLSQLQIQAFLDHYYPNDPQVRQLSRELGRHRELNELVRVPFLLGVIAEIYRQQGQLVGARLELYRQIVTRLVVKLDREKLVTRFLVSDEAGIMKRALLKTLAFDRLFIDPVDKEIERLVFTEDDIASKAVRLCRPDSNPGDLVSDVIATPLLREVGSRTYAFAHLTIQEYLAAEALSEHPDFRRILLQKVFNPTIVSMEVLPMALGLSRDRKQIYSDLEELPESLIFTVLRLRARSLAYTGKVSSEHLSKLFQEVISLLSTTNAVEAACRNAVFRSFVAASDEIIGSLAERVGQFLSIDTPHNVRIIAINVLGEIGGKRALALLNTMLSDHSYDINNAAINALRKSGYVAVQSGQGVTEASNKSEDYATKMKSVLGIITSKSGIAVRSEFPRRRDRIINIRGGRIINTRTEKRRTRLIALARWRIRRISDEKELLRILRGDDPHMRRAAAEALVKTAGESVIDGLIAALEDLSPDVRLIAATTLGKIGNSRAAAGLWKVLKDENEVVRTAAQNALWNLDPPQQGPQPQSTAVRVSFVPFDQTDKASAPKGKEALLSNARSALPGVSDEKELIKRFVGNDPYIRRAAAEVLIRFRSRGITEALCECLTDTRADVRLVSAITLGRIGDKRATTSLLGALKHDKPIVLREVIKALGKIGDARTVDALIISLRDPKDEIRSAAALALGKIGDARASRDLVLTLSHPNPAFRKRVVQALGKIRDPEVVSALLHVLHDESDDVQLETLQSLGNIGTAAAVDGLLNALSSSELALEKPITRILGEIGDPRATERLRDLLQSEKPFTRYVAAEALGKIGDHRAVDDLLVALKDPFSLARCAAAEALGKIGDKRAVDGLIEALRNVNYQVRESAAVALGRIGDGRATRALLLALRERFTFIRTAAADALRKIRDEQAISGLLAALNENGIDIARLAAVTLGRLNDEVLTSGLEGALSDPDARVRLSAAKLVGYYTRQPQVLNQLLNLAVNDLDRAVREAAVDAHAKLERKIEYFDN